MKVVKISDLWYDTDDSQMFHGDLPFTGKGIASSRVTYFEDGYEHRLDGPSTVYLDGKQEWMIEGWPARDFDEWLQEHPGTDEEKTMLKLKWG